MTLKTFFEKFDLFADAPDAVAKMRELVLSLAVQGKLVQAGAADEDVEHLLARNDKTRSTTAKSDRRADAENQPLLSADDRWEIPESWSWRALADLVLFVDYRGKTPAKLSEGIRLLTAKNVRKGEINLLPEEFLSEEEYHTWMTRGFPKAGDVLFTTEAPMGNAAVVDLTDRFALAQRVICFQSYGVIDSSFLVLQILSTQFQFILDKNGTGVTAKGIKASKLKQLPIAVPPLAEQKRIVAKVDELMALCDRLETQQQEREAQHAVLAHAALARFADAPTPVNLDFIFHKSYAISPADLRKSILTLAVQGKLVPQEPDDEPAHEGLVKVLSQRERLDKSLRINEPSPVEADAEHKPELPNGWCYASPDQMTAFHKNALTIGPFGSSLLKSDYTDSGVPLVFVRDIRSESFGGPETRFILPDKAEELASHTVRSGDLLITKMGDPPGDTSIYPEDRPPAIITADCIKLTPHNDVVRAEYLRFAIRASQIADQFREITLGVAQQKVSLGRFRCIAIPLPPLAEQRRIVAKVDQLMALVDALETQLAESRAAAANLLSALVAELTGTAGGPKVSAQATSGTGRRGRPRKAL